ncbi:MAG TPA: YceI family protein [Micromonosporaceae bacterium]
MADSTDVLSAAVGTWTLDAAATTINVHTKAMWGMVKVNARFRALEGSGAVGADGSVTGSLTVDAASVDSGVAKRDQHLRTKDFFEVETHPTFVYEASAVTPAGDGSFTIAGTFTVHGQARPLAVTATATPDGADRVTVHGTAELDRTEWGLNWTKMGARVHNHIVVDAVFTKA